MPAGSCRRPTRGRRHGPASLTPAAVRDGLGLRAGGDAERELSRGVLAGGVHHDLEFPRLGEGRRETGVAVAARVVVLEIPPPADAGTPQEEVRIEVVGLEVD